MSTVSYLTHRSFFSGQQKTFLYKADSTYSTAAAGMGITLPNCSTITFLLINSWKYKVKLAIYISCTAPLNLSCITAGTTQLNSLLCIKWMDILPSSCHTTTLAGEELLVFSYNDQCHGRLCQQTGKQL